MADSILSQPTRIYSLGFDSKRKNKVLELIPKKGKEKARLLLRTGEENAVIIARISRTAGTFDTIATEVDEEGAAKFHAKWTVSVEGYGHKSVGEHAIIQAAVENVSSEEGDQITDNRLGSYTEFSARFKGRQGIAFFIPPSVVEDKKLNDLWIKVHNEIFETCDILTNRAREWMVTEEAEKYVPQLKRGYYKQDETDGSWMARLGKHAADQFKNMLPASRLTSMGVTWNATEAENALRKLQSSPAPASREVGKLFKQAALDVAPTLVKYADFNLFLASLPLRRERLIKTFKLKGRIPHQKSRDDSRTEIITSKDVEALILAAFAFESVDTGTFQDLVTKIESFGKQTRARMFSMILEDKVSWNDFEMGRVTSNGLRPHDMPPRAFEFDGGYIFYYPDMLYGDWRDYKRHRMQSYIAKPLDIKWGYAIPPIAFYLDKSKNKSLHGSVALFNQALAKIEELFKKVRTVSPIDARYAVTRAHFRPAIARFNMREAFHLLRLRTGNTAHPSVRRLMWPTYEVLYKKHPNIVSHMNLRGEKTGKPIP